MSLKALIAVRSGSVRVPNKNIRPFAGSNLLELKIHQLKRLKNLDGVVVNSNDDNMLAIARQLGCECVKREELYASNDVSMSEVYKNMAENFPGDTVAYTNVTNPLIKDKTLFEIIEAYKRFSTIYDSVNTAHYIKEFLFQNNAPINYELKNQPRSQDLPDILALNFACNVLTKETMIKCKNVVGETPHIYAISELEATDIDNEIDFEFAEYVFNKD
jgi:CMP-N-acetylneuraminic acid synthetase